MDATRNLPAGMFKADGKDFSLGADAIASCPVCKEFARHTPMHYCSLTQANRALVLMRARLPQWRHLLRSLFAVPTSVIANNQTGKRGLVLSSPQRVRFCGL